MRTVIGRFTPQVFAIMRIVTGLLFACHGSSKLLGWPPSDMHPPLASLPGLSGIIELVCGLLITVGFLTGIAAFIASGEMAVAYWKVHAGGDGGPLNPIANHGEAAVLYCFLFLYIAARGTGPYSLDRGFRRRA